MFPSAPDSLRLASPADLDAVMEWERGPGYEAFVGRSSRAEHEAMHADPRYVYLIGEGAFAILRDLDDAHGNVYLKRIAVAQPGRGEGARFLASVLDWTFARSGPHRFHLDCFEDNFRAQALYAKLGFTRDGLLREAYLDPQGRRRTLVMMALTRPEWNQAASRRNTTIAP
jgi:RimJ/RimL family protein N-acetyltransferase